MKAVAEGVEEQGVHLKRGMGAEAVVVLELELGF
jgi:hypothetical protein